ncbi:MAG: hypothetical protein JRI39_00760 [Deltaproteobacteria bacterium]|nr:hypothetical protein [Deltaproteobacteria bacterium]
MIEREINCPECGCREIHGVRTYILYESTVTEGRCLKCGCVFSTVIHNGCYCENKRDFGDLLPEVIYESY